MSIVLSGDLSPAEYESWRAELASHLPADETLVLAPYCQDRSAVDIAFAANPPWGQLAAYPNLRFVQSLWAGVERLLHDPSLPGHIVIARLVDPTMAQSMLEGAVAAVLYVHRHFPAYLQQQHSGTWRQLSQPVSARRQVGILGFGQMAQPVARGLTALGFRVRAWGLHPRSETGVDYSWGTAGLKEVLADTQILVNLLPLTATTAGILNAPLFNQLAPGAALINLGRGGHLQEEDLLAALQTGRLSHAVLDVFNEEPLPATHPFWSHPQITVLPHVAASTDPASAAPIAVQNVAAFRAGQALTGLVSRSLGY
jgi:glyoxylate/hydroxypyruvate reductase A